MDSTLFPGSWSLVKRNLPGLLGAGLGAAAANFAAGRRAYLQAKKDTAQRFPTWSEKKPSLRMSYKSSYGSRRVAGRRRAFRRYGRRLPRGRVFGEGPAKTLIRTSPIFSTSVSAATSVYNVYSPILGSASIGVYTSDLTSAFRLYKIKKVVLKLVPRVDPANSGLTNNFQALVAVACDPEDTSTPGSIGAITAYDNSYQKFITSSNQLTYTFYPKPVNAVGVSGATAYVGSYASNPWLQLNATGLTVPHNALKLGINTGSSTTINFDMYFEYHFLVKGIA